jgi:hypothetical protein
MELPVILKAGEDGLIVAECPVIPGCIGQGRTHREALRNVREAIEVRRLPSRRIVPSSAIWLSSGKLRGSRRHPHRLVTVVAQSKSDNSWRPTSPAINAGEEIYRI